MLGYIVGPVLDRTDRWNFIEQPVERVSRITLTACQGILEGDQRQVARAIATALGLTVHSEDTNAALVAFLRDKNLMLVLDNCEHVIDAAADVAECIVRGTARVCILATSREALRAGAEEVYRLPPLETPPSSIDLRATDALTFPAIELFVERATRSAGEFVLDDTNAPQVGEICRSLDGIALAIEAVT